jgi:penicillin-binding protein 1C
MTRLKYFLFIIPTIVVVFFAIPPRKDSLYPDDFCSLTIYARDGTILREVLSRDYKTSVWVPIEEISPWLIRATITREDKRFSIHPGIDIFAMIRALYDNIRYRKITSGGSTITMQVAKMVLNFSHRNIFTKLIEIIYALKIDIHLSKKDILEIYLNRAPYGNQTYGAEAASRFYFHKPASQLSLSESCVLAVIPRAPSQLDPYRYPGKLELEKRTILEHFVQQKIIDSLGFELAVRESSDLTKKPVDFRAPHFVDFILREIEKHKLNNISQIVTSINSKLEEDLEKLVSTTLSSLERYHVNQAALIVMDVETGEILAMVGSKDYFDAHVGQVNGCLALRQPGSSIKPFLYALALMQGISASYILPDTLLEFQLADGTLFAPRNYGNRFHGPTRLREALGSSFNVPAVYLLEKLGIQRFYNFLKEVGFESLDRDMSFYGLSLSLGAAEASLLEMTNAFRMFARKGKYCEPKPLLKLFNTHGHEIVFNHEDKKTICSQEVAYVITHILSDNASRIKAFGEDNPLNMPFPCAAKTGTSKDYRDNWCIGFTKDYIVGVWVGNFEGSPMQGVSGISGAAPLFRDVMIELHRNQYPADFEEPSPLVKIKICAQSGSIASSDCPRVVEEIFIHGTEPSELCKIDHDHAYGERFAREALNDIEIINPSHGDIFKRDPQVSYSSQGIRFKVSVKAEIDEVIFKLDGEDLCKKTQPFEYVWSAEAGEHVLEAVVSIDGREETDRVSFTVY